jgi:hypothetical protein
MGQRPGQLYEFQNGQRCHRQVGCGRTSPIVFVPIPSMVTAPGSFAFCRI